ncbi:MAG: MBL fold metallo-hydrolase [Gemmatimonas sp.]
MRRNAKRRRSVLGWTGWILGRLALLLAATTVVLVVIAWESFGKRATGARRARMEQSPQWKDGKFVNPQPLQNDMVGAFLAFRELSADATPRTSVPVVRHGAHDFDSLPASGLRVTWMGHSTSLIEIDGKRVLTDPVWSDRPSPFSFMGPRRYYAPLIAIESLPPIDAVVVSHDHYDHLDRPTIIRLTELTRARFIVPLGVASHLEYWGVPLDRIVELDWWQDTQVDSLRITLTPARHASGRTGLFDNDATLWGGYAIAGPEHRVYYSGDTGLFPAMNDIGTRLGPFDVTLIETGQYHRTWPDWHIGPEQAVNANERVQGKTMIPVHWGLFTLAMHSWTEPVERTSVAAQRLGVPLLTPEPGEFALPLTMTPQRRWWPHLKWQTAQEHPIVSTQVR